MATNKVFVFVAVALAVFEFINIYVDAAASKHITVITKKKMVNLS